MSVRLLVPCRFSYLNCWEPKLLKNNKMGYSVSAIIPKSDTTTINKIKDAVEKMPQSGAAKYRLTLKHLFVTAIKKDLTMELMPTAISLMLGLRKSHK